MQFAVTISSVDTNAGEFARIANRKKTEELQRLSMDLANPAVIGRLIPARIAARYFATARTVLLAITHVMFVAVIPVATSAVTNPALLVQRIANGCVLTVANAKCHVRFPAIGCPVPSDAN
jgi:hypothetical protein